MRSVEALQKKAAHQRAYYERHREVVKARKVAALNANPAARARAKEIARAWAASNPDKAKDNAARGNARRKAARLGIKGELSPGLFQLRLAEQRGLCAACGDDLSAVGSQFDHIVALANGGPNTDDNVRLVCPSCNAVKGARDEAVFRLELAARLENSHG